MPLMHNIQSTQAFYLCFTDSNIIQQQAMKRNKPKFVLSLKTKEGTTFKGLLITQNQEWDS